jgi:thiamine-monophosphate kinase
MSRNALRTINRRASRLNELSEWPLGPRRGQFPYISSVVISEKAQILKIRLKASVLSNPAVIAGIGDDCAVLRIPASGSVQRPDKQLDTLLTTDFSLEGIHFRRDWHSPESIGHRCLARGLSDIAAMGGDPVAAFLSLALPSGTAQAWVDRFTKGLLTLAGRYKAVLAGGDTAESPAGIVADIIVLGTVPKGRAILRSGARPGERIYVSGELGGSAAAVSLMQNEPPAKLNPRRYPRHFFPEPRIALGRILREKALASAMIDTSDGLSTDLAHICEESGVGAVLRQDRIPRAPVGKPSHVVHLKFALHGGEDYELLFTAAANKRIPPEVAGVRITQIGEITRGKAINLIDASGTKRTLQPQGWEHFRK